VRARLNSLSCVVLRSRSRCSRPLAQPPSSSPLGGIDALEAWELAAFVLFGPPTVLWLGELGAGLRRGAPGSGYTGSSAHCSLHTSFSPWRSASLLVWTPGTSPMVPGWLLIVIALAAGASAAALYLRFNGLSLALRMLAPAPLVFPAVS
jgi:hypothetical protein